MKKCILALSLGLVLSCSAQEVQNCLLGGLPSVYLDFDQKKYELGKKAAPECRKLFLEMKAGKITEVQFMEGMSKFQSAEEKRAVDAEMAKQANQEMVKLDGKEITYKMTPELSGNTWYEVLSAPKLYVDSSGQLGLTVDIKDATMDFEGYWTVSAVCLTKKGEVIAVYEIASDALEIDGQPVRTNLSLGLLNVAQCPEIWAEFAEVVFCTHEQCSEMSRQAFTNRRNYSAPRRKRDQDLFNEVMPEVVDAFESISLQ